jgi:CubicO group peptidase (beta-lactamase class C family)
MQRAIVVLPQPAAWAHRFIASITLGLVACSTQIQAQAPTPSLEPAQIEQAVAELDALAPVLLQRSGVPGMAIAVVGTDRVYYSRGFGVRDINSLEPIDTETIFQLASLSKPLSSTIVAGVVGDGIVSWDTTVSPLVPELELASPSITGMVTIGDFLAHRSGLPDHAGDLLEDLGFRREQIAPRLQFLPLAPFRASNHYTNIGYTAGALAAARAVGLGWPELAEQRLFDRVGMSRSSYRFVDYILDPNHASLHAYVDGQYLPLYERNADVQAPAGSASASINDMARWLQLQLNGGLVGATPIIDPDALLQTQVPQSISHLPEQADQRAGFYGYGWNVGYDDLGRTRLNHSGAFMLGAATTVSLYPGEGIGIVVLTNGAPYGLAEATAASFFQLLFEGEADPNLLEVFFQRFVALWAADRDFMRDYSQPPVDPAPPLPSNRYGGLFSNPYYGLLVVAEYANRLMLWLGPQMMAFPLSHWDGNLFVFETTGENALGLSGAEFHLDDEGQVSAVTLERYNKYGQGRFERLVSTPQFQRW